jgi:TonB-linked SusC/RagA family outer membrane protein
MKNLFLLISFFVLTGVSHLSAQKVTITGTVSSSVEGEGPMVGVSVVVKGTTTGTSTDLTGKYTLAVPPEATTLVFSYIGMKSQEIVIAGRTTINIVLDPESLGLNEVIVTALGIKRSEKTIGYSASTVNSNEINSAKASSLITGLQGKVAGLSISSGGGTGTSQKVYIRGVSSFTGSNQPLYVINGVPMSNNFAGNDLAGVVGTPNLTNNTVDFGNQANDINPDDVESVTVLKGASATALYGSRAANGVIMITTKRGAKEGKISVVYSGSITGSEVLRTPQTQHNFGQGWPFWDPAENGSWGPKLDGRINVWGAYSTTDYGPGSIPDSYPGFVVMKKPFSYVEDNLRSFYETGIEYQNNISISGGDAKNSFAMSYGNTSSDGVVPTKADLYKRNIFSFRGDHTYDKFKASYDISYVRKDIKSVSSGQGSDGATLFQELSQMPVDVPLTILKDYNSMYHNIDNFFTLYVENPYWVIDKNGNNYQDDRIYGKIELEYNVFANTKVMGRLGGDFTNLRQNSYNAIAKIAPDTWNYGVKSDEPGTYDEFNSYNGQIDASGLISGDYKFFGDFRLNVVTGINYNTISSYSSDAYLYGLSVPNWFSLSNGSDKPVSTSNKSKRNLVGVLGQFDLSYKEWAFATISLRNDWSSTLPPKKNSYFYAGVNGAVLLTEAFPALKNGKILDYAKVRAAWGQTGNDAPVYRIYGKYIPTKVPLGFGNLNTPIGGELGMSLSNLEGNINLKPEITTDIEFGADLKFLGNRIGLDVAYYLKSTKDQIISSSVAPETMFTTFTRNVGQVDNKGIETRLSLVPVETKDFDWEIITTFSRNRSNVVKLWDDVQEYRIAGVYGVDFVAEVGQPLGVFKVPQAATTADGKVIVGSSGRPTIDPVNKKIVGSREPDFVLGLSNRFTYKGISLAGVLDYRKGGRFWSNTAEMLAFDGNSSLTVFNQREPFLVPNSVRAVGDTYVENDIPILGTAMYSYYTHSTNTLMYEYMVLDKTFLKLRELTLSYAIPRRVLSKTPIKALEFSLVGRNLLMWTPATNNFVDPEATNFGNDLLSDFGEFSAGPSSRFFGGNVKISF